MFSVLLSVFLAQLSPTELSPANHTSTDPFLSPLIQEIQELHSQSEQGDKDATQDLLKKLEELTVKHPDDYLLLSYLGSAYTLASRDAFPGPGKLNYLKKGLKTMDAAVEADPDNLAVRFIRAVNNFHLPAFVNRRDNARCDFEYLIKKVREDHAGLSNETVQAIHYYAGMSYKQLKKYKEASIVWKEGLVYDSSTQLTQKIADELSRLKL